MTNVSETSVSPAVEAERRRRLGDFFRSHRVASGMSVEQVATDLELSSVDVLVDYETGQLSMPLEDVFALTNLLNIAPEAVMDLVHTLYMLGAP